MNVGRWRVMALLAAAFAASACVSGMAEESMASSSGACDTKGQTVIMKGDSDLEAVVVAADCTKTKVSVTVSDGKSSLVAKGLAIEVVKSVPDAMTIDLSNNSIAQFKVSGLSNVTKLVLNLNAFSSFKDVTVPSSLKTLDLSLNNLASFDGFDPPSSLVDLFVGGNAMTSLSPVAKYTNLRTLYVHDLPIKTFADVAFPDSVQLLNIMNTSLSSWKDLKLPPKLTQLDVSSNSLSTLPDSLPDTVISFKADYNKFTSLERYRFPTGITTLNFENNPLTNVEGVYFPWNLQYLKLGKNEISNFVISRDDMTKIFSNLKEFTASVNQASCKNPKASRVVTSRVPVCVLDTDDFSKAYGDGSNVGSLAPAPAASSGSKAESKSSNGWVAPVVIVICIVVVIAIGIFAFRRYKAKTNKQPITLADTLLPGSNIGSGSHHNTLTFNSGIFSQGKVTMNPHTGSASETSLVKYRIAANEIIVERALAKGGFGIVYLAQYQGRVVVVKKILPEKASDDRCLKGFLDEIKLCSTLDHPKVVKFLGVSWNTLSDISVIMEYMPNGDLDVLLKRQHERKLQGMDDFDWYQNSSTLPSRAQIALDVLEAVVYLHSFSSPIIHRDLKAKNVLLSKNYEAKLSDFGISREWAVDQTMTAGIGTMAWIAPEVLRGERYTEKADIYSFGVMMSELATYQKPFEGVTNALIVLKVTSGEEQPQMGQCPEDIRELSMRCLSYHPSDRPSAMVAHYELRTLLKLHTAFEL
ncbi:TPA: hypothetical protein N0F65_000751 [Lagenidium giganteum]|uniref:Protein kinase domain-containing protein n=1 Tax=Lagenidium giganteum TaxID=4803 RepID=A0AAV2ZDM5_9STRA|nr:TPA: hypothetical protein N0F65_000751 [Lagenidium giganteum]